MGITYNEISQIFHLQALNTSYILQVFKDKYLVHLYWGKKLKNDQVGYLIEPTNRAFSPNPDSNDKSYSLDVIPLEYPLYGNSDYRQPAVAVQLANGSTITDLSYKNYRIIKGKSKLEGLPATYVEDQNEAETLELNLVDELTGLQVVLSYTVFESFNAITRSAKIVNQGREEIIINQVMSMSVDFGDCEYEMLQLSGAWARERHLIKRKLVPGVQAVESRRGASSHQQNPFIGLLGKNSHEDYGEVYGFSLVYSGNFIAGAEVDQWNSTRVFMGINPFDFSWKLEPGGIFQTPEVVMVYSANGLGEMSRTYHKLYRTRLCRGEYRDQRRPVLVNNWEATYFNFDADTILALAKAGKELGIELLVLDDGWFGHRNDDRSSLGDWVVNRTKLPAGLPDLVTRVNEMGMKFGLWFEPEMVSPDSELYRKHPDWCIHVPGRTRSEARHQLVLDFSRTEVCEAVIEMISAVLASAPIAYVKWDCNRHLTEIGSAALPPDRQRETAHRHLLGVYQVMEIITARFPQILFESCSGGGGRFDPGLLY